MVEGEEERAEATPEEFLNALGEDLKGKADVDKELAEILATYILKVAPAQDAVARAKAAIVTLAGTRTTPAEAGAIDG